MVVGFVSFGVKVVVLLVWVGCGASLGAVVYGVGFGVGSWCGF